MSAFRIPLYAALQKKHLLNLCLLPLLLSCAVSGGAAGGSMGEAAPCADCRSDAPQRLRLEATAAYREWGKADAGDTSATLGILPPQRLVVPDPGTCSICHSFSSDAVDFDFHTSEETLLRAAFPHMQVEILFPGLRVPERDSALFHAWSDSLQAQLFADARPLRDPEPWRTRSGVQNYARPVPPGLRTWLGMLGGRYGVRYLAIPVYLEVELQPKRGSRGGFRWESLWTLWDVHQGELIVLDYQAFTAASNGSAPPDRLWSATWAAQLAEGLAQRSNATSAP